MRLVRFATLSAALLVTALPAAGQPELADLEREIFALVDAHRASEGLEALTRSAGLADIARSHSRAMASGKVGLGHSGFDERKRAVNALVAYSAIGENVLRSTRPRAEVPAAALRTWLASAGHRRKIEGNYELSGLGVAVAPDGTYYLTQIFIAKL